MLNCQKIRKREFKLFLFALLIFMSFIFCFAKTSSATSQSVIEAAKKEGEVNLYASMSTAGVTRMIGMFRKKNPFLKVNLLRVGSQKLLAKTLAEYRMKKHTVDVLMTYSFSMYTFMKKGVLGRYTSPESRFFPDEFRVKDYWTGTYCTPNIFTYNTRLVRKEDLPKTYDDLLDPKWKGKMMMEPTKVDWFANMLQIMGREKGLQFMKELAKQDIDKRTGHSLVAQLILAGEAHLSINQPNTVAQRAKATGGPFDWFAVGPVPGVWTGIGISANPPNPNAAKVLVDYVLSEETQNTLIKAPFYYNTVRKGVPKTDKIKALQIVPVKPELAEDLGEYGKLLREIFWN